MSLLRTLALATALTLIGESLVAQEASVPHRKWRTITTENFRVHYPIDLEPWAKDVGGRLERIRVAVGEAVGYTPPQVIDVIIEDPINDFNGSAMPRLLGPSMRFWAVPPDPGILGDYTDWGELLAIHEYAHLAHLLRPSRNARKRWLEGGASPFPIGPVSMKAPAWVTEGFATVIEGRLTNSGRPNGVHRPAIIRQWALEGALPSYGQLGNAGPFLGGAMRYLVGSAYLEWLSAREGWDSFDRLWRRMSARTDRNFAAAFQGVYGEPPAVLYGRFVAEVTAEAKALEAAMHAQGPAEGVLVQHLAWTVGGPAVAPSGKQLALRRATPGAAPRIVVWADSAKPESDKAKAARERAAARDPEGVPAKQFHPRPLEGIASLAPVHGIGFDAPRYLADGERLLVVRHARRSDGTSVPDLWLWRMKPSQLTRVTRGAAVRAVDPFPDGTAAAGLRCGVATCDIVRVSLTTGVVSTLAAGTLQSPFAGVRVSPDGTQVATSRKVGVTWEVTLVDAATGALTRLGPRDGASRYDAAWLPDGSGLVVVSEASGTPQLERMALDGTTRALTRGLGIVRRPDVGADGRVWFLAMHPRGWDLRTVSADSALSDAPRLLTADRGPVAPAARAESFPEYPSDALASTRYGVGPLGLNWFPMGARQFEGEYDGAALTLNDPIGRIGLVVQGALGGPATWQGGGLGVTWRGFRPALTATAWGARQAPSRQRVLPPGTDAWDNEYHGAALVAELPLRGLAATTRLRAGLSVGELTASGISSGAASADFTPGRRELATVAVDTRAPFTPRGAWRIEPELTLTAQRGRTQDAAWDRWTAEGALQMSAWGKPGLRALGAYGRVNDDAPRYERFTIGGGPSPFVPQEFLGQRVVQPALPFAAGGGTRMARVRLENTGALQVYHEWFAAGDGRLEAWRRLVGAEFQLAFPVMPALRVPSVALRVGAAMPTDGPRRHKVNAYSVVVLSP